MIDDYQPSRGFRLSDIHKTNQSPPHGFPPASQPAALPLSAIMFKLNLDRRKSRPPSPTGEAGISETRWERPVLIVKLKSSKLRIRSVQAPTHLPPDILLNEHNFIHWKPRMNTTLAAHGLPAIDAERPDSITQEKWTACSEFAARIIHTFVPRKLLSQVGPGHYYDHSKLVKDLKKETVRFRFLDLPEEVRNRIYHLLVPENTRIVVAPLQKSIGQPPVLSVSSLIRKESLPIALDHCNYELAFEAVKDLPADERLSVERAVDIPKEARKWVETLTDERKDKLRKVIVRMRMPCAQDATKSEFRRFKISFAPEEGLQSCSRSRMTEGRLPKQSRGRLKAYVDKIDYERKMLGLQARAIIMAITRDDEVWKYGTLKC